VVDEKSKARTDGDFKMNPRIKELAEQAGLGFDDNLVVADEPIYFVTEIELEKFAELIVRDCAGYIHGYELFTALLNRYGFEE